MGYFLKNKRFYRYIIFRNKYKNYTKNNEENNNDKVIMIVWKNGYR